MDEERKRLRNLENAKARYRRLKNAGLCVTCAKKPPREGHTQCEECAARIREEKRMQYAREMRRLWGR